MRLLSLTLDGFKSFAQKTTIKFEPGMTGIVGPNGSGKSNIIEAIRWVMGEQSARQLRGNKMADVIFNGTADRKPLNRAVVSITLDNSDHYLASNYSELTITRKLYRNGDSEYLINGSQVRLKDITDLFIDSGLGRESFSIISQGRVAAIFNGKPLDRRRIIETVAGVAKYQKNKEAAEKRLADTMDNLNRVNDIISELAKQLEPLEDEQALAQDYLEQKKRFDVLDRTQTVRQYDAQHQQLEKLRAKGKQASRLAADYQSQQKQIDEQLTVLKKKRTNLLQQREASQQTILSMTERIAQLTNQQSVSSVKRDQQLADQDRLKKQVADLNKELTKAKADQTGIATQLQEHRQQVAQHQQEYDQARQMSESERLQALNQRLSTRRDDQINLMQKLTTIHNQQTFLKRSHEQSLDQQSQSASDLATKQNQQVDLAQQLQDNQKQVATTTSKVKQLQTAVQNASQALTVANQNYQQAQRNWYEALGDVHSTQARIKSFQALSEEYAGYYQGVRTVLQHRQQFPGLAGAVSELLNVPAKLTVAIETALGSQLQQLVVDRQSTGQQIINYLIQRRGGRVTILPVDTLIQRRPSPTWSQVSAMPGVIGRAVDLIHFAPKYQVVANYLLGNTVVADTLGHAAAVSRAGRHQLRLVTLDGQLINASGSMTGGANRKQRRGLLSQKQVGSELVRLLKQQQQQAQRFETKVAQFKQEQVKGQKHLNTLQDQLRTAQQDLQAIQSQNEVLKSQSHALANQVQTLQSQTAQQGHQTKNYQSQAQHLADQAQQAERQQQQVQKQIVDLTKQIHELETNTSAKNEQLHQMEQWLAVAAERQQHFERQQHQVNQQVVRLQQSLKQAQDQLKQRQAALTNRHSASQDIKESLNQAQEKLRIAKQTSQKLSHELTTGEAALNDQEERHDRIQSLQEAAADDAGDLKAQLVRCESTLDQLLNHLSSHYQMTIAEARQHISTITDAELARQLKLLKRGLDDLGDVNVGAIAEYQRVKKHYDFLKGQQDDLLTARKQLNKTMNEMDSQVVTRFRTTFKQVSTAFDKTFRQIFGGGHAKLILTDPHDILTTGVDIMAQPPGKKNQQLSLLSGGERALTAITLLFAILKVRPVPFAILDEPEAALDEVNVQRFTRYLNRFGKTGPQFIVITHRKGTMMGADVLYGVTMQESGVSKMVSVDVVDTLNQ